MTPVDNTVTITHNSAGSFYYFGGAVSVVLAELLLWTQQQTHGSIHILTLTPMVLVLGICHWVSLRIFLRR